MYINTSFKYHRVTWTQSCVVTKVHDLLGQPSYMLSYYQITTKKIALAIQIILLKISLLVAPFAFYFVLYKQCEPRFQTSVTYTLYTFVHDGNLSYMCK